MKNITLLTVFLVISSIYGCNDQDNELVSEISYPEVFDSKLNVLIDSTFIVEPGIIYSLAAYLPKGTSIRIECIPTIEDNWGALGFIIDQKKGFIYQNDYPSSMTFEAEGKNDYVNVPVMFGESAPVEPTSIDFYIYENESDTVTKIKTVRTYEIK